MCESAKLCLFKTKDRLTIGWTIDGILNGLGFYVSRGHCWFGIFNNGILKTNLTNLVQDAFSFVLARHQDFAKNTNDKSDYRSFANPHEEFFGLAATSDLPCVGFHFMEDGTVYVGCSLNDYDISGYFLKIDDRGQCTYGYFKNKELLKVVSQETYVNENYSHDSDFWQYYDLI